MYLYVVISKSGETYTEKAEIAMQKIKAKRKYGDFSNEEAYHRMICDMAGGVKRKVKDVLYLRIPSHDWVEECLYIQSNELLDETVIDACGYRIEYKLDLDTAIKIKNDSVIEITARLAPTKQAPNRTKRSLFKQEERLEWLQRRISGIGAHLLHIQEYNARIVAWKHNYETIRHNPEGYYLSYMYKIVVHVKDADKFRKAMQEGLGRGKAYGCGLLLCRPVVMQEQ